MRVINIYVRIINIDRQNCTNRYIDLSNLESLKNFLLLNSQRQINEKSIETAREKLACLKSEQSDLVDEIKELMDCFHSKMKQVEKLMALSVALGPIAS